MEPAALVIFVVVNFALFMSVTSEPFIEAQDASMEKGPAQTNMKRYHSGCYVRHCYYYRCPQGYYCYNNYYCCRRSYPQYPYCSSQSNCKASQCCAKHQQQQTGMCKDLKKAGEWCPIKPDAFHCGCGQGYECRRYHNNYYWGKCTVPSCSSDASCQKTHCCSGGQCKPQKKANEFCPFKGPDRYHCGCVQGFECRQYHNSNYWGKCTVPSCSSDASCQKTHCCSGGQCKPKKKANEFCPFKGPDHYHCGCVQGFGCRQYRNNNYWGKCTVPSCSSDASCQKTHCCSGGQCKPKKKANEFCPLKGADKYHCGCVEGYECRPANVNNYWGKCVEESGSGLGENIVS